MNKTTTIAAGWALAVLGLAAAPGPAQQLVCLPSCSEVDGRFLAVTPAGALQSLSPEFLNIEIAVDGSNADFLLGVFDGDTGAGGPFGHWDLQSGILDFKLFADPLKDGTGTFLVDAFTGAGLADNAWADRVIVNPPEALAPSGNYFYRLEVRLISATSPGTISAFKIRTSGLSSIQVFQQPFAYIATLGTLDDARIVYPGLTDPQIFDLFLNLVPAPTGTGTTYDGSFSFFVGVETSRTEFKLYDGDFDRGNPAVPASLDDDDPDTPNDATAEPFAGTATEPPWALLPATQFEGQQIVDGIPGKGNPAEDRFENIFRRSPAIRYQLHTPDGRVFFNSNPSGNVEWEKFRIKVQPDTVPCDTSETDFCTPDILPPGIYEVRLSGLDMQNLNFFFFFDPLVCALPDGSPCPEPRPFLVGDTVFEDPDQNGFQDGGEPGIGRVAMELVDPNGFNIGRNLTGGTGLYFFEVDPGTFTVRVAPENFELASAKGAVGDRVWLDADGDNVQDPGEAGLANVKVLLFEAGLDGLPGGGDDFFLGSVRTDPAGNYLFGNLDPGTYFTRVDEDTIPAGLTLSAGTNTSATHTVTADEIDLTLDFGYRGTGGAVIGDRVWHDVDGDGAQDGGEPGIPRVTVELVDLGGDLALGGGDDTLIDRQTTAAGSYLFTGVPAGSYAVIVTDDAGVLAGYGATGDPDEPGTCAVCDGLSLVTVAAGDVITDRDFGYRDATLFSIADAVWFDSDRDGLRDTGEPGLEGVEVALLGPFGNVLATTSTAGDGSFSFDGLGDADYGLKIVSPSGVLNGLVPTTLGAATGVHFAEIDGADASGESFGFSNLGVLAGAVATTVSPEQTDTVVDANVLTYDFGYFRPRVGAGTPGYWKNHPEAWPVDEIQLGDVIYTQAEALAFMALRDGDKTITLTRAMIAAKLNLALGSDPSCILQTVFEGDLWLAGHPPTSGVKGSSDAWDVGEPIYKRLDRYNNGNLCAPSRDRLE